MCLQSGLTRKTHTDHKVNFESHHPKVKRGIIKCLRSRAVKVCHVSNCLNELAHFYSIITAKWYPDILVRSILYQVVIH